MSTYMLTFQLHAGKTRNALDEVKDQDRETVRKALHRISHAGNINQGVGAPFSEAR